MRLLYRCERHPLKLCGAGCIFQEGLQQCHDHVVGALIQVFDQEADFSFVPFIFVMCRAGQSTYDLDVDLPDQVPEEVCDLIPHKSCKLGTKLLPRLSPLQKVSFLKDVS